VPFFEWTPALWIGLPLVTLIMAAFVWRHRHRGLEQLIPLTMLRAMALVALVLLAGRPTRSSQFGSDPPRHQIVVLVDRSESMALQDQDGRGRYQAAIELLRAQLIPAIEKQRLSAKAFLFADDAAEATGEQLVAAQPDGKQTNLPGAISRAVTQSGVAPLAVVVLSDGISTDDRERNSAAAALLENGVPFVGIGFGSEAGPKVLSLTTISAPARVAPGFEFRVDAVIQAIGSGEFPGFELVLLRDGKLVDSHSIKPFEKARIWQESFRVQESEAGRHQYTVRVLPPADPLVRCTTTEANALVTVADEDQWRVLFVQGGLTWDFKFIQLAVKKDPALHITCLSRTASGSRFFQNVESETQLVGGFPATIEQLSSYRVVVLANLKPSDLGAAQQELLVRFCQETGGGVLLLGGSETFNLAWRGSALEQLLPVRFAGSPRGGLTAPFRLQPTDDALRSPVFQINKEGDSRSAWNQLPAFSECAHVQSLKPGAVVWMQRGGGSSVDSDALMAVQRYGAGRTAALCVPNLWRWRLAKDAQIEHYDHFWQQLFRYLGGGEAQPVAIHLADQLLMPNNEIHATLEQRPSVEAPPTAQQYRFVVEDPDHKVISEQKVELAPAKTSEVVFQAAAAGLFTLRVLDAEGIEQGSRTIELKNLAREFEITTRDMENLRQWAQLSDGFAVPAEECGNVDDWMTKLKQRASEAYQKRPVSKPAGVNGWMLVALIGLLGAEWGLRRWWSWT
jgi:hypothetical protein